MCQNNEIFLLRRTLIRTLGLFFLIALTFILSHSKSRDFFFGDKYSNPLIFNKYVISSIKQCDNNKLLTLLSNPNSNLTIHHNKQTLPALILLAESPCIKTTVFDLALSKNNPFIEYGDNNISMLKMAIFTNNENLFFKIYEKDPVRTLNISSPIINQLKKSQKLSLANKIKAQKIYEFLVIQNLGRKSTN